MERGVELDSILCSVCQNAQEDVAYLFFHCDLACQIWSRVGLWLDLTIPNFVDQSQFINWIDTSLVASRDRMVGPGGVVLDDALGYPVL